MGGAGGSIAVANPDNLPGWCVYFLEFLNHYPRRQPRSMRDIYLLGANSSWQSTLFNKTSYPDQTLGEDMQLSVRAKELGYIVIYDPSITVAHFNRTGWGEFLNYCRAMGKAAGSDQQLIGGWKISVVRRFPLLVFTAFLVILPLIFWRLLLYTPRYLARFVMLLPCCLVGHLLWSIEFYRVIVKSDRDPCQPQAEA